MPAAGAPEEMAVDESRSTSELQELKLTGQDITDRPELPYPVGLQGFHSGPTAPGDVVAAFFPPTLQLVLDLRTHQSTAAAFTSGQKQSCVRLRALQKHRPQALSGKWSWQGM